MWDPRFPELAAGRLHEQQVEAARQAQLVNEPGMVRRRLGTALMRLGERLAAPSAATGRPATVHR